jgi:hypothetical protein
MAPRRRLSAGPASAAPTTRKVSGFRRAFLGLALLPTLLTTAFAGTWSVQPWNDDATSGIGASTIWAYHFGSENTATVNGVSVPGSTAMFSNAALDIVATGVFGSPYYSGVLNSLAELGGNGSAVLAEGFIHAEDEANASALVKNLIPGAEYTVTFLSIGFDADLRDRTVAFTSGGDQVFVEQNTYGFGKGIRLEYHFTATSATQSFSAAGTTLNQPWHFAAVSLRNGGNQPVTTELGAKGTPVAGAGTNGIPAGAVWASFGAPSINVGNQCAVLATFKAGTVSTTAIMNFHVSNPAGTMRIVAKKGDLVPGLTNTVISTLKDPLIGPDGAIAWVAGLANAPKTTGAVTTADNLALFLDNDGGGEGEMTLMTRKGAPAGGGATIKAFSSVALGVDGLAYTTTLGGTATAANDSLLWFYFRQFEITEPLVREGDDVLGSPVKTLNALVGRPLSPGQGNGLASTGSMDLTPLRMTLADKRQLLMRTPTGFSPNQPYVTGDVLTGPGYELNAQWAGFGLPTLSATTSAMAFLGTVKPGTGTATTANNVAIFAEDDIDFIPARIVAKGDPAAGVDMAKFSAFKDPVSASQQHVAFIATVKGDTGSTVTSANNDGIWTASPEGGMQLIAREGAQPTDAPEGAQWKAFTSIALPEGRGPLFTATMASKIGTSSPGPGGITTANDTGLWGTDSAGTLHLLLQEGQAIGESTVKSFAVLTSVLGSPAQTRSFNEQGSVIVKVTDAANAQHLLLIAIP